MALLTNSFGRGILSFFVFCIFFAFSIEAKESVFLLHGFLRTSGCMHKMAAAFEKQGYDAYAWGYPSRSKYIEEHAFDLTGALIKRAKEHPGEPIHFVTHSLGGLIVRAALNRNDCPIEAKIGKAVLLSPPNQGSSFAKALGKIYLMRKFFGDKSGYQLIISSNFEYLGQFPHEMDVLVISGTLGWNIFIEGKNDGKVSVTEARLSTKHKHLTVLCGHSWIMYANSAIRPAVEFIIKPKEIV